MITRKEIKKKAKHSVKTHYWIFVVACLMAAYLGTEFSGSLKITETSTQVDSENQTTVNAIGSYVSSGFMRAIDTVLQGDEKGEEEILEQAEQEEQKEESKILGRSRGVFASIVNGVASGSIFITIISAINSIIHSTNITVLLLIVLGSIFIGGFWFFVVNTYSVVLRRIFMEGITYQKVQAEKFLFLIRIKKWTKASWTMFVKSIYSLLWSMTIIGGIIKHYSYAMVPYIVAENPDISANQAITLSRRMMNGHKWEYFMLELSFIGWYFFGIITAGLGKIFFTNLYWSAILAEYYKNLRTLAKEKNIPGAELLNDTYLFEKADPEEIERAYADVIEIMSSPVEEMNDLKGILRFLADWFGILLVGSKKEKAYEESQMKQIRIDGLREAVKRKTYPKRLFPIAEEDKRKREEFIYYMRHYTIWSVIVLFFTFSFIGWLWEVSLHLITDGEFVNRGVLQGPWLPIYGTGGILILILLNKFRRRPILEFVLTIVLCGGIEYFTSYYLEVVHGGIRWWDYSGYFLNLNGRICAEGLLVFGIGGIGIVYFLAPMLDNQIRKIKTNILIPICIVLLSLFITDQIYSSKYPNTGKGITDYAIKKEEGGNSLDSYIKKEICLK